MQLPQLPVLECVPALKQALADVGCAVLAAPPGSGKTTLVPITLLNEPWLGEKKILMLEPRRLATRAAAARMAHLLGVEVGGRVGYQIRFERRVSAATRIEIVTEALLTRRLQSDPELPGVGLVIFDEFHERSLDADLALALTLDARANLNPALRVLVMSATLDTDAVAKLLDNAPIVRSHGQLHPVEIRYRPVKAQEPLDTSVAAWVRMSLDDSKGDVLAFLPGGREIRGAQRKLQDFANLRGGIDVLPLYGDMDSRAQDAVLQPSPQGRRKVILATNIAQTSLTIEGVSTVVDGGYARVARFDLGSGANRLETQRISRAAADQRAGRAGRLGPGLCYRLWSDEQHGRLPAQDTPEILVGDLCGFVLELAAWGVTDPARLRWLDPPPAVTWQAARELLQELEAIDKEGRITAHGRELAKLPTAPRRAHMLLVAQRNGCAGLASTIAAVLDERDGRFNTADLAERLQALEKGEGFDPAARRRVRDAAEQLARLLERNPHPGPGGQQIAPSPPSAGERAGVRGSDLPGRVVAWAYPERIARRRHAPKAGDREVKYLCVDGGEAQLSAQDPLARSEWLAIAHWDPGPPRRIYLAAALEEAEIERDHAAQIESSTICHWDAQVEAVVAEEQRRLGALVLARRDARSTAGEASRKAMLEGIRSMGLQALPWTDATQQWRARVMSLRAWRPEESWPDLGDDALLARLDEWLGPHLDGITRRDHLARLDMPELLHGLLDYRQQQALARLAPTHIAVPSGSRVTLSYEPPGPPVLAVKLQELFGLTDTPKLNDGRTPVSLHLLSPARRPIQVTQDLAGFWRRTYPEVKKELKGRYPKHYWPDDPLVAEATARAKPRGT